jgi:hypothetical protein
MGFEWSSVDWAVVLATFVGPIVAVIITLWYQERSSRNKSREDLFVAMMRTRRTPINIEFVGALNLVPVHFWKDRLVMQRYAELMAVFSDPSWSVIEARSRLVEQVEVKVAYLLSELSKAVSRPVEQLEILRGAYAPQGWKDEEQAQADLRSALSQLLSGARALPVFILPAAPPAPVNDANDGFAVDKSDQ